MAKNIFDDKEIVDMIQLGSRHQVSENVGEDVDQVEKEIVQRMSDKSLNWYLSHMVPISGRPILKKKWSKFREKSN